MMSVDSNWLTEAIHLVKERNEKETGASMDLAQAYFTLWAKSTHQSEFATEITNSLKVLRHEVARISGSKEEEVINTESTQEQLGLLLGNLQNEIQEKFKGYDSYTSIKDDLNKKLASQSRLVREHEEQLAIRKVLIDSASETIARQKRDLELVQQELRSARESRNVAEKESREIKAENSRLLRDLLKIKARTADEMNDMNNLVDSLRAPKSLISSASSFFLNMTGSGGANSEKESNEKRASSPALALASASISAAAPVENEPEGLRGSIKSLRNFIAPTTFKRCFQAHNSEINDIAVFDDSTAGSALLTASADGSIKAFLPAGANTLWDTGAERYSFEMGAPVLSCATAPNASENGLWILGGSSMGTCRLWRSTSAVLQGTISVAAAHKVRAVEFIHGPELMVTGGSDRQIRLWNLRQGALEAEKLHAVRAGSTINTISKSLSGGHIATGHQDGSLRIFSSDSLSSIEMVRLHSASIAGVRHHPVDDNFLLTAGRDNVMMLIDQRKYSAAVTFRHHSLRLTGDTSRVAFSPDGNFVVAGSSDGAVLIFSATDGKLLKSLPPSSAGEADGHETGATSIAWGNTGLVSADKKGKVVLWY